MDVQVKQLPQSKVEITVKLVWDEWKGEIDHATEEVSKRVKIEGFRQGKAPRHLVEQKAGKGAIIAEAADHALRSSYARVLREQKIDAIGRPKAELVSHEENGALEYVVETAVVPTVEMVGWEKAVKKVNKDFADKKAIVEESAIDAELKKIAESRAKFVTVNREAQSGDAVEIDFAVSQDNVPIENGTSKQHHIVLGSGSFIPGFEEALLGMKSGEEKSFELSFPEKYHVKHLAGKPAHFDVKMRVVQERDIPVIDDAFATSLGKFENLEAFRANISDGMLKEAEHKLHEDRHGKLIEAITESAKADVPDILLDEEIGKMIAEFEVQLGSMGADFDSFLSQTGKNREEIEKEWRPQAYKRVLSSLALEAIAKEREIEPSAEEIETEMNRVLQYYRSIQQAEKDIDLARLHQYSSARLRNMKVLEFLETRV